MKQLQKITWRQLRQLIVKNIRLGIFGKKKLLLAFEYGVTISEVAKAQGIELTPEIIARAEKVILDVSKGSTSERVALDMIPNILAIFETDMTK